VLARVPSRLKHLPAAPTRVPRVFYQICYCTHFLSIFVSNTITHTQHEPARPSQAGAASQHHNSERRVRTASQPAGAEWR
jgi:hypothetical protein